MCVNVTSFDLGHSIDCTTLPVLHCCVNYFTLINQYHMSSGPPRMLGDLCLPCIVNFTKLQQMANGYRELTKCQMTLSIERRIRQQTELSFLSVY